MGEFYATLCALIWAFAVILFRKSGERVGPVPLNVFKNTVATLLFVATGLLLAVDFTPAEASSRDWIVTLASGALGIGLADSLFFASLNRLGAGRVAIVDCSYGPFVLLCTVVYLHEPVTAGLLVAAALMVAAIVVGAFEPKRLESGVDRRAVRAGVAYGLLGMLLMAIGVVLAKPVLLRLDALWVTSVRVLGGMALLGVHGLTRKHRAETIACFRPGPLWRSAVPAAVLGSYIAMFVWLLGFKHAATATAGVLNQLSTIFVLVLAAMFLREPLTRRKAVAVALGFAAATVAIL